MAFDAGATDRNATILTYPVLVPVEDGRVWSRGKR